MSLVLREKRSSLFAVISFSEHNLHPHESLLRKCESRTSELTCPVFASLTAPYTALCPSSHALILTVVSGGIVESNYGYIIPDVDSSGFQFGVSAHGHVVICKYDCIHIWIRIYEPGYLVTAEFGEVSVDDHSVFHIHSVF